MPTFPPLVAKYAEPVELRTVVEALAKVVRPVRVGDAESTRLVEPVEPETSESEETRLASVSVETRFLLASVATRREAVRFAILTTPVAEIVIRAVPAVVKPIWFAPGRYIPVLVFPVHENEGAVIVSAD